MESEDIDGLVQAVERKTAEAVNEALSLQERATAILENVSQVNWLTPRIRRLPAAEQRIILREILVGDNASEAVSAYEAVFNQVESRLVSEIRSVTGEVERAEARMENAGLTYDHAARLEVEDAIPGLEAQLEELRRQLEELRGG